MYFTQEDYRKIEAYLKSKAVRDTSFDSATTPLQGNETIVLVQGGKNVNTTVSDIVSQFFALGVSDFINVTDKYGISYNTLDEAIRVIPWRSRKVGQVITFLNEQGEWHLYQYQGESILTWNNTTLWVDLLESRIVNSILPDQEDLTMTEPDADGNSYMHFKNKDYSIDDFSGLGRVYLRKNLQTLTDPNTGETRIINYLTQTMVGKENVIYHIQYDYNLNGQTIIIPEGCVLLFEGGSISNGTIIGNNTKINAGLQKIFNLDITINGTWGIVESYPEWFGAKKDGVTVNTSALQTCINSFDVIKLGVGTYLTRQLIIPSFKNILGEGKNTIIKADPSMALTNNYLIRTKDGGSGIRISNLKIMCGNTSNEADYKIGGIGLISTANTNNDQWDTRNIIENVEILNCYATSIYIGTYQRENKIQNCFISNTTNNGINCQGTDNMINGCTVAGSHLSGIMLQGNNRLSNTKLFGCGKSSVTENLYALDIFGSKCNVSNVELQQNYYGGVVVRGNSNYVQVTNDNNGSGNTAGTSTGASIVGSYNTVIITSYNFSFHDDAYERYFASTNWNTVGNTIIVNGTPLNNNKMAILSPWTKDNITNTIISNGFDLTERCSVKFPSKMNVYKYTNKGTGSISNIEGNLRLFITSATAIANNCIQAVIPISKNNVDPNGVISAKMLFKKTGDTNGIIYPYANLVTTYTNASGSNTRTDACIIRNNFDNEDYVELLIVSSLHHANIDATSITNIVLNISLGSKEIASDLSVEGYFTDITIGAKTLDGTNIELLKTIGTTEQRPTNDLLLSGFEYFDTTLNAPIMWDGTKWINEDGTLTSKVVIV